MKRKPNWGPISPNGEPNYWEESWAIPADGVHRGDIQPLLEELFFRGLGAHAWRHLGKHWLAHRQAFTELDKVSPDGMEAMARYCTRDFLKQLPESGITEQVFWDEYMLKMLRLDHQGVEDDETLTAYLKSRIGKPGWPAFLQRFAEVLSRSADTGFGHRFLFCMLWDLFPLPLRFWADSAAADLLAGLSSGINLDKVRNTRRELGLSRDASTIVKSYLRKASLTPGGAVVIQIEIDERMAAKCGLAAMVVAFGEYLKGGCKLGS